MRRRAGRKRCGSPPNGTRSAIRAPILRQPSRMPVVVAGKVPANFSCGRYVLWSDARSEKRGTQIDRHLTSHSCRTSFRIVSGQVVTISDAAVARWARNGSKKTDRMAFCVVFGRFLGEAAHMLPRFL